MAHCLKAADTNGIARFVTQWWDGSCWHVRHCVEKFSVALALIDEENVPARVVRLDPENDSLEGPGAVGGWNEALDYAMPGTMKLEDALTVDSIAVDELPEIAVV